jgi:hypothetical protein
MGRDFRFSRAAENHQSVFDFEASRRRRVRQFKRAIVVGTLLVIVALFAAIPRGRDLAMSGYAEAKQLGRRLVGMPPDRSVTDEEWARRRSRGVEATTREYERIFQGLEPPVQRLMEYTGNDPRTGILRWGNFDQVLLLPSTVFEADDTGRSYRLRSNTRSVWLRNLTIQGIPLTFFIVPQEPGLADAMQGTTAIEVPGSVQTTNSWGLRGPEPDANAEYRGIVLGDSFMQGLFIGDDDTPPERLRRELETRWKKPVSILNTGHLGYSPEQEYFTLKEYTPRFRPQFVVLSLFANDFGDLDEVLAGKGDWGEGKYWLDQIAQFCRTQNLVLLTVAVPHHMQITTQRREGFYPGLIANLLESSGIFYLDPLDDFIDRHLELMIEGERQGNRPTSSPLYNGVIGDGHFSAIGSGVWAKAVARRIGLLIEKSQLDRPPSS